jgi:hypothetical protein
MVMGELDKIMRMLCEGLKCLMALPMTQGFLEVGPFSVPRD